MLWRFISRPALFGNAIFYDINFGLFQLFLFTSVLKCNVKVTLLQIVWNGNVHMLTDTWNDHSQKQNYTISKNLNFKMFSRGGQTHLDKKISLIFRSMGWNLWTIQQINRYYMTIYTLFSNLCEIWITKEIKHWKSVFEYSVNRNRTRITRSTNFKILVLSFRA